ncbi:hypothetical protein ACVXHB_11510 [Escherichia coli]
MPFQASWCISAEATEIITGAEHLRRAFRSVENGLLTASMKQQRRLTKRSVRHWKSRRPGTKAGRTMTKVSSWMGVIFTLKPKPSMRAAVFVTCNLLNDEPGWVFWLASVPMMVHKPGAISRKN